MEDITLVRKGDKREERLRVEEDKARLEVQRMKGEEFAERERLAELERASGRGMRKRRPNVLKMSKSLGDNNELQGRRRND